ncbi:MAG TPA: DUF6599 family protein [Candidatus Angelobacter sp.]|nr:DUF6599 family protein [Candidatus Angelobacter sp.]
MRKYSFIFALALLLRPVVRAGEAPLLPASFSGWHKAAQGALASTDPAAASPANAALLKEYGFVGVEAANFVHGKRTVRITATRFADASGAYGAFSLAAQPEPEQEMRPEKIGDQAVAGASRIVFYCGNILVEAQIEAEAEARQSGALPSSSELAALAETLPPIQGNRSALPTLPGYLPRQSLEANTERYILGPVALDRAAIPIPARLVDFGKSAEVVAAKYKSSLGDAGLTLIEYPTPQIAAEQIRAMQAQSATLPGGPFYFKRSGPIVAVVNGQAPSAEAESLLASVNYHAEITMNQPTKPNRKDNAAEFLVGLIMLTAAVVLFAFIFGFFFGGLRVAMGKMFPNTVLDRTHAGDFIRLNLR